MAIAITTTTAIGRHSRTILHRAAASTRVDAHMFRHVVAMRETGPGLALRQLGPLLTRASPKLPNNPAANTISL